MSGDERDPAAVGDEARTAVDALATLAQTAIINAGAHEEERCADYARPSKQARIEEPPSQTVFRPPKRRVCQVDGCTVDLLQPHIKNYNRRNRVCETHMKGLSAMVLGRELRYCQQCHTFHSLNRFDGTKQSCRAKLEARAVHVKGAKERQRLAQAALRVVQSDVGASVAPYHSRARSALVSGLSSVLRRPMDASSACVGQTEAGQGTLMLGDPLMYAGGAQMGPTADVELLQGSGYASQAPGSQTSIAPWSGSTSNQHALLQVMQRQNQAHLQDARLQGNTAIAEVLAQQQDLIRQHQELLTRQQELLQQHPLISTSLVVAAPGMPQAQPATQPLVHHPHLQQQRVLLGSQPMSVVGSLLASSAVSQPAPLQPAAPLQIHAIPSSAPLAGTDCPEQHTHIMLASSPRTHDHAATTVSPPAGKHEQQAHSPPRRQSSQLSSQQALPPQAQALPPKALERAGIDAAPLASQPLLLGAAGMQLGPGTTTVGMAPAAGRTLPASADTAVSSDAFSKPLVKLQPGSVVLGLDGSSQKLMVLDSSKADARQAPQHSYVVLAPLSSPR